MLNSFQSAALLDRYHRPKGTLLCPQTSTEINGRKGCGMTVPLRSERRLTAPFLLRPLVSKPLRFVLRRPPETLLCP
ncbi:hypothetical protein NXS19_014421 [Fusarium pseudograminearum]|nr:hypothetical protein NXS19_014421 [Fusarium pseudograminearum]